MFLFLTIRFNEKYSEWVRLKVKDLAFKNEVSHLSSIE